MAFALAVAIAAAYATALSGGFVLDSAAIILENPALRRPTWANVEIILTHDYWYPLAVNGLYRPLTTLSYLFDDSILGFGTRPFGYHLSNVVLHWACAMLVYGLVLRLSRDVWAAALAAALFALHPVATEAVANIVGRADELSTIGVLAGLSCYARLVEGGASAPPWPRAARPSEVAGAAVRLSYLALLAVAGVVAFASKESGALLLPLVLLWEVVVGAADARRVRLRRLGAGLASLLPALALVAGAGAWVRSQEWPAQTSFLDNPLLAADFWSSRATALEVVGQQMWTLLWPLNLAADYSYDQIPLVTSPGDAAMLLSGALVTALLAASLAWRRRQPALAFLVLLFLVALLPTSNLLITIGSIRADRFLYLPLVGFAGVVAIAVVGLARRSARPRLVGGVAVAVLALAGAATARRNLDWASDESIWASALEASPNSAKVHKAYASALFARDRGEAALDRAVAGARQALAIWPAYAAAMIDLSSYQIAKGDALAASGDAAAAARWYEGAVDTLRRARALDRRDEREFRRRMLERGRRRVEIPDYGTAALYRNLGLAYVRLGRFDRARVAYRRARQLDPWSAQNAIDLSAVQANLGDFPGAAASLFQALALDADNADAGSRLVEVYRLADPGGRSLALGANGRVDLRLDDPAVHRDRCRAYAGLARVFRRARLPEVEARLRRQVREMSCASS